MDSNQEWKKMEEGGDAILSALLNTTVIEKLPSTNPVAKIRRAILINACWGMLINGGYLFVLLRFPFWQLIACTGLVILVTLGIVVKTLLLYRQLGKPADSPAILQQMEQQYNYVMQWIHLQQWIGLVIYPACVTGGFLLGGSLGSGKSIEAFLQQPGMFLTLPIVILVLVPVGFYLTKWMNHQAFGQYAMQLKTNIEALKRER